MKSHQHNHNVHRNNNVDRKSSGNGGPTVHVEVQGGDTTGETQRPQRHHRCWGGGGAVPLKALLRGVAGLLEVAFFALFVWALIGLLDGSGGGDKNAVRYVYLAFVVANIVMSALFLVCLLATIVSPRLVSVLAMAVNIWALVYIIVPWFGYEQWGDRKGAFLGMTSSIICSVVLRYCLDYNYRKAPREATNPAVGV